MATTAHDNNYGAEQAPGDAFFFVAQFSNVEVFTACRNENFAVTISGACITAGE